MQKRPDRDPKAGPLLPEILDRWSPRAFNPERILTESEKYSLLEALRWGASSGNNQPWKLAWFGREDKNFEKFADLALMEGNAIWAKNASALAVIITDTERGGESLDRAEYTTGLGVGQLIMQVQYIGLFSHHMSGIYADAIKTHLRLKDTQIVQAVIAIGEQAEAETLPEHLAERETAPRSRLGLAEIVIYGL